MSLLPSTTTSSSLSGIPLTYTCADDPISGTDLSVAFAPLIPTELRDKARVSILDAEFEQGIAAARQTTRKDARGTCVERKIPRNPNPYVEGLHHVPSARAPFVMHVASHSGANDVFTTSKGKRCPSCNGIPSSSKKSELLSYPSSSSSSQISSKPLASAYRTKNVRWNLF